MVKFSPAQILRVPYKQAKSAKQWHDKTLANPVKSTFGKQAQKLKDALKAEADALELTKQGVKQEDEYLSKLRYGQEGYAVVSENCRKSAGISQLDADIIQSSKGEDGKGFTPPKALKVPAAVQRLMPSQWGKTAKEDTQKLKEASAQKWDQLGEALKKVDKWLSKSEKTGD